MWSKDVASLAKESRQHRSRTPHSTSLLGCSKIWKLVKSDPTVKTPEEEELYSVRYEGFEGQACDWFGEFFKSKSFGDVTVICQGIEFTAHRLVLASCSKFFRNAFHINSETIWAPEHSFIKLRGIPSNAFSNLLQTIYFGNNILKKTELESFVDAVDFLGISDISVIKIPKKNIPDNRHYHGHRSKSVPSIDRGSQTGSQYQETEMLNRSYKSTVRLSSSTLQQRFIDDFSNIPKSRMDDPGIRGRRYDPFDTSSSYTDSICNIKSEQKRTPKLEDIWIPLEQPKKKSSFVKKKSLTNALSKMNVSDSSDNYGGSQTVPRGNRYLPQSRSFDSTFCSACQHFQNVSRNKVIHLISQHSKKEKKN